MQVPYVIGRDFDSRQIICKDIFEDNTLLIGSSGTGKSNLSNLIIHSSMYLKNKIRFHLFDSRNLEFSMYKDFENVTLANTYLQITESLNILLNEIDLRIKLFESLGAVDIEDYNKKFPPISYIVIVIDDYMELNLQKEEINKLQYLLMMGKDFGISGICSVLQSNSCSLQSYFGSIICFKNILGPGIVKLEHNNNTHIITTFFIDKDVTKNKIYSKLLNEHKS